MVVIDSCVLVDMFRPDRARHSQAYRLRDYLHAHGIEVRLPMHAMLELGSAMVQERREHGLPAAGWPDNLTEERPLRTSLVPIDQRFIDEYLDPSIPVIRAGDYPFVAIAKRERLPLITEDGQQREAALASNVSVFSIQEYLASVSA